MFESFLGKFEARLRNSCLCIFGLENWNYSSFGAFLLKSCFLVEGEVVYAIKE